MAERMVIGNPFSIYGDARGWAFERARAHVEEEERRRALRKEKGR